MPDHQEYTVRVHKYYTEWRNNQDQLHRTDGPAIEHADGTKYWYLNGQRHRTDGPAVEHTDGTKAWYLNGQRYTEFFYKKEIAKLNSCNNKIVEIDGKKYQLKEIQ